MKRGPLKRTKGLAQGDKPLARRTGLRGGAGWQKDVAPPPPGSRPTGLPPKPGLARRGPLAPIGRKKREAPRPTAQDTKRIERLREAWAKDITLEFSDEQGRPHCAVCDRTWAQLVPDHRGERFHRHHVIAQQRLKRIARSRGVPEEYLLWDARGGLLLCVECHWNHEHGVRSVPHRALTYSNLCFASDVGEEVYLERTYPIRPVRRDG